MSAGAAEEADASSGSGRAARAGGIGVASAAALVAGNMLGAGVFTTSGFALADLGRREWVLLAWVLGGGIAACGAHAYAALARRFPGNGGEYLFLSRALHPMAGFLAGWVSLFAGFTAPIAVAAHGLEAYAGATLGLGGPAVGLGAGAILLCGLAHGLRRAAGLGLQNAAVALKAVAIAAFLLFGAIRILGPANDSPAGADRAVDALGAPAGAASDVASAFPLAAFAVTLVWISFAYSGWNAAVYVADEITDPPADEGAPPARTLGRATWIATVGVGLVYVALNALFLWSAPAGRLAGAAEVGAIAAEALGGEAARAALSAIVALALLTSISAMVMVGPRVTAQMADDGLLPRRLGRASGGMAKGAVDVPVAAVALQIALALAAFFLAGLRELLLYSGFLLGLSAAATVASGLGGGSGSGGALDASSSRSTRVASIVFIGATLFGAAFVVWREPRQAAVALGTLALGALAYGVTRRLGARGPDRR